MKASSSMWAVIIVGEVLMYGAYGILVNLSKVNGQLPYLPSSFVLCTEMLKLIICLTILWCKSLERTTPSLTLYNALPFAVPALCYCLNNNLAVIIQTYMDPATYMVLGNLKIITTAILYRIIMKKNISTTQWFSIGLLALGGFINSCTALRAKSPAMTEIHTTWFGLFLLCCYCVISGFSGVFTEFILKQEAHLSVYYQNALLYMFGVVFNFSMWVAQIINKSSSTKSTSAHHLYIFQGYTVFTWALIFTQAATGLIMSLIMKHTSNIVRLFIISSAPMVTALLSHCVFHLHIPSEFVVSLGMVAIAVGLYNYKASQPSLTAFTRQIFK